MYAFVRTSRTSAVTLALFPKWKLSTMINGSWNPQPDSVPFVLPASVAKINDWHKPGADGHIGQF